MTNTIPKSFLKRPKKDKKANPNQNHVQTEVTSGVTQNVDPDTGPTAPDYNQTLRKESRFLIAAVGAFLWLGHPVVALCCTIASIVLLHQGTSLSVRNWKWRFVAWGSLVACGLACFLQNSLSLVDEEKAYKMHLQMRLTLLWIETCWSILLWIIIGLAFLSKVQEPTKND